MSSLKSLCGICLSNSWILSCLMWVNLWAVQPISMSLFKMMLEDERGWQPGLIGVNKGHLMFILAHSPVEYIHNLWSADSQKSVYNSYHLYRANKILDIKQTIFSFCNGHVPLKCCVFWNVRDESFTFETIENVTWDGKFPPQGKEPIDTLGMKLQSYQWRRKMQAKLILRIS